MLPLVLTSSFSILITNNYSSHTIFSHLQLSNQTNNQLFTMETAKNAVNYVTESIQGTTSEASKEANKDVAKDSNADVTAR